jgi:hypothetical protein
MHQAFQCTSLKEIYVNAETVGSSAFYGCTNLEKIAFGDNVKVIEEWSLASTAEKYQLREEHHDSRKLCSV